MCRCNLPPALLAEWPGTSRWQYGVEWKPNKSRYRKLTVEKKILPAAPAGTQNHNLSITSPTLYQQARTGVGKWLHMLPSHPLSGELQGCSRATLTDKQPTPQQLLADGYAAFHSDFFSHIFQGQGLSLPELILVSVRFIFSVCNICSVLEKNRHSDTALVLVTFGQQQ